LVSYRREPMRGESIRFTPVNSPTRGIPSACLCFPSNIRYLLSNHSTRLAVGELQLKSRYPTGGKKPHQSRCLKAHRSLREIERFGTLEPKHTVIRPVTGGCSIPDELRSESLTARVTNPSSAAPGERQDHVTDRQPSPRAQAYCTSRERTSRTASVCRYSRRPRHHTESL
jgi:hypothetical protein